MGKESFLNLCLNVSIVRFYVCLCCGMIKLMGLVCMDCGRLFEAFAT